MEDLYFIVSGNIEGLIDDLRAAVKKRFPAFVFPPDEPGGDKEVVEQKTELGMKPRGVKGAIELNREISASVVAGRPSLKDVGGIVGVVHCRWIFNYFFLASLAEDVGGNPDVCLLFVVVDSTNYLV